MEQVEYHRLAEVFPRGNFEQTGDLDFYQVSLRPDATGVEELVHRLCGSVITLAANIKEQARGWTAPEGMLLLSLHPIVLATATRPNLKEEICQDLSRSGYPVVPTKPSSQFICYGIRPVPIAVLMRSIRIRCSGLMLVSYGMKQCFADSPVVQAEGLIRNHHPGIK